MARAENDRWSWAGMRGRAARRRALWTLLWRAAGWRAVGVGALVVLQGLAPTAAVLASGVLIDSLPHDPGRAVLALGGFACALLLGAVLGPLTGYQVQVINGRYGRTVHRTVARATLRTRGVAELDDPLVVGELAALGEFERADGFVATATHLRELVQRRTTGLSAFVVLLMFAWWAPLVMLAGWRALSHGIDLWLEKGVELGSSAAATGMRRSRYLRRLVVGAQAAKEVRVFGLADWLVRGYADTYVAALRAVWEGRRLGMRTVLAATSGVVCAHVLVLGSLGWHAASGALSAGQLVVFVQAVLAGSALGHVFGAEIPLAKARHVAWQALRLERLLANEPPVAVTRPATGSAGPVGVCLRDVWFTYPGREEPALRGLELSVPAGQSLAVVGENGAGKSTLIKLLCGLYEPGRGSVEVAGVAPADARERIGAIFQNFVRYELPLRENVAFGDLAMSGDEEALAGALADAGAGGLADRLPSGWDTVLSSGHPGGQDLSGGQWQKVALARALAAVRGGAGLLILDEPTASLDVRAERELFDRFRSGTAGTTTILVTHRLASVRHADRIVVIAGGRVVEDGSHEELMATGGRYAAMFRSQAERFTRAGEKVA
ncbi:ABC transporter ATP-binding protein [Lentzea sp. HUAS TT2]|uniref:ABC transporter ATP-binding protein n=1 Tax=Lentzea sp. HUAS TT2 TaxID=3447454 RepID=UPI003F6EA482